MKSINEKKIKCYKNFYYDKIKEFRNCIDNIKDETINLINNIFKYNKLLTDSSGQLQKILDKYLTYLDFRNTLENIQYQTDLKERQDYITSIQNMFSNFINNLILIYNNRNIDILKELNDKMNNIMNGISNPEFDPPNLNSFNNNTSSTKINTNSYYSNGQLEYEENECNIELLNDYAELSNNNISNGNNNIYNDNNNSINYNFANNNYNKINNICENNKDNKFLCHICSKNEAIGFCELCNQLFCQRCYDIIRVQEKKDIHKVIFINNLKNENEKQKKIFLNSMNNSIKFILISCNTILKKEKIRLDTVNDSNISSNNNNNKSIIKYIKRKFDLPFIKKVNNFDSQIDFIKRLKSLLDNKFDINNFNKESFNISDMHDRIIYSIKNLLEDDKINMFKKKLNLIDNNFHSDDDDVSDEKYEEEKYIIYNEEEFQENCNNFYYVISLITKRKGLKINKKNIKNCLLKNMLEQLNIQDKNIFVSFDNKKNFIEEFIKTNDFDSLSINKIKNEYPDSKILLEYKMIYDNILKNNKNYLDYNGNTINPNSSYNYVRGTEKYVPPYGWYGIGLKVIDEYGDNNDWLENKTNTSKWAIAYYGIGQYLSFNQVKEALNNIIIEKNLIPGISQNFKNFEDKRNPGNKIGEGIYLTPNINLAEKFSGIILINNKRYKVVFMARVLIEKIREPDDIQYWILNKEDIRIYRILVKEINN